MSTRETNALFFAEAAQEKILDYVGTKSPPVVISQTPKAGSPVPQGMAIEVKVASKSDIPIGVAYLEEVPEPLFNLPLDKFEELVDENPILLEVKNTGVLPPEREQEFLDVFANEGIQLNPADTGVLVNIVKESKSFNPLALNQNIGLSFNSLSLRRTL